MIMKNYFVSAMYYWLLSQSFFAVLFLKPFGPQDNPATEPDLPPGYSEWSELCEITDCERYPVGNNTYAFGPHTYYFPSFAIMIEKPGDFTGGVRPGRFLDLVDGVTVRRSFSDAKNMTIADSCHYLAAFYDVSADFPSFRGPGNADRMPSAWTSISRYGRLNPENSIRRRFGGDFGDFPPIEDVVSPTAPSYNDDFWVVDVGETNSQGFRPFRLLSKQPLFHGRRIFAWCDELCSFGTMSFVGDEDETRPQIVRRSMVMTGENMFLCSAQELNDECDPSPDAFDGAPVMLSVLEDLFESASIYPQK